MIARSAPGIGNPLDLTIAEFDEHSRLAANGYGGNADTGGGWMRRHVERSR